MVKKNKTVVYKLGQRQDVEGLLCEVRFINAGIGFLFPVMGDPDDWKVMRCLCFAKAYPNGEIKRV